MTVVTLVSCSIRLVGTLNATGVIPEPSTWNLVASALTAAAGVWAHRRLARA